ncbi:MAG: SMC-Scp complex subunit ScpB [Solobacterium sp.]|nr:SMC-Scp complex subunit ScpB [Solobacterium sp.]
MSEMDEILTIDDADVLDVDYDDESAGDTETEEEKRDGFLHLGSVLEGLLFLTGDEGLTLEQASDALGTDPAYTESLFDHLQRYYLHEDRGIEIARYGNVYRFLSKASVHEYAKKLFAITKENRLSSAALETLAIIAYKQPVTRVEIEEIRGVGADVMLRKLEARGLIREDGRSDAPGRPFLYSVTDEFMDSFKLLSLDELPELPTFGDQEEGELF